jgi:hypothetical protein
MWRFLLHPFLLIAVLHLALGQQLILDSTYIAGTPINILYEGVQHPTHLVVSHSYGTYMLYPKHNGEVVSFDIPNAIAEKRGGLDMILYAKEQIIDRANTLIIPETLKNPEIEAYCGPKHLIVGGKDQAMMTLSLLDQYGNPYPRGTIVALNSMISDQKSTVSIETDDLIGYHRIASPNKTGFGAVSAAFGQVGSKEFRLDFYANDPMDYYISVERQHGFADGSQLVRISTSVIKDGFGNVVEDGTLINFQIRDTQGTVISIWGESIEGIAEISIPAPIRATNWIIDSFIANYAKSNSTSLSFAQAIDELAVSSTGSVLSIGPVLSFMNQFVKEGTLVKIEMKGRRQYSFLLPIKNAKCSLLYEDQFVEEGAYTIVVSLGGLTQTIKTSVAYD